MGKLHYRLTADKHPGVHEKAYKVGFYLRYFVGIGDESQENIGKRIC